MEDCENGYVRCSMFDAMQAGALEAVCPFHSRCERCAGKGAALVLFNDVAGSWGYYKARQVRTWASGGRVVGEHEGEKEPLSSSTGMFLASLFSSPLPSFSPAVLRPVHSSSDSDLAFPTRNSTTGLPIFPSRLALIHLSPTLNFKLSSNQQLGKDQAIHP